MENALELIESLEYLNLILGTVTVVLVTILLSDWR